MFVDVNGVRWTLLALLGVAALCALDLHCSNMRDRAKSEAGTPEHGAMAHVRKEISAGRHEMAVMREDQINDQLRTLRAMSRQLARSGRSHDAQRVISVIQELEAAKEHLHAKQRELEKKSK